VSRINWIGPIRFIRDTRYLEAPPQDLTAGEEASRLTAPRPIPSASCVFAMPPPLLSLDALIAGIRACDRAILGRAITLVESRRDDHRRLAQDLLTAVLPESGKAHRVGITGVPGVGKSTFIEAFGGNLTAAGHKVAVLAVDPSSTRTGGSILADKTRMGLLSNDRNAFIRPSPSAGTLGGVTRTTRETMILCEAAGFDVILVETVGVGQSETIVADMVDFFLVLMLPGAGDELQGIKKGVLEVADMIAVNKAEGENEAAARRAARDYRAALHMLQPARATWSPSVVLCSGLRNVGLDVIWNKIVEHRETLTQSGELSALRRQQLRRWMWSLLDDRLHAALRGHPDVVDRLPGVEHAVMAGTLAPAKAVDEILSAFGIRSPDIR